MAVVRGKRCRNRVKSERAARGIQERARSWLRERDLQKQQAARKIQGVIRRRQNRHQRERYLVAREESLFLLEDPPPEPTTMSVACGREAPRRRRGNKKLNTSPR
ncbi:unnamed protein product, partial [Pylaiella littoralis]